MADFDLTQTDQQVQNILNDGQSAMGAGAQTTLTTEYVMLKGTNGRYHKILKDSLTEACRNVLAGLLVNNDKGTTISQIAAIASGDFGSVTPANLASVLGGVDLTVISSAIDFDDYTTPGWYQITSANIQSSTHAPTQQQINGGFRFKVEKHGNLYIQVGTDAYAAVCMRVKWDNLGWSAWRVLTNA